MDRFHYLKAGLAFVLAFVGTKMLLTDVYSIPIGVSLAIIGAILAGANGDVRRRAPATAPFQRTTYENSLKETPVLASVLAIGDDTFVIAGEKGVDAFQLH
jgi:hypothetical protein